MRPTLALPAWPSTEAAATTMQDRLRGQVITAARTGPPIPTGPLAPAPPPASPLAPTPPFAPRTVAGLDVAYDPNGDLVAGAVVLLDPTTGAVRATSVAVGRAAFPYVPGLLAFREIPALIDAWNGLPPEPAPELVICDGYGVAHPRRFGLACHIGLLTGLPTIGVAKSAFIGEYRSPASWRGAWTPLVDGGETVGAVLRTRDGVRPVFVSVGHLLDLPTAVRLVLEVTGRFRLPETTRAADQASRRALRAALAAAG